MILNKFFGILYFLFVNLKLSKSQNLHHGHGVNQISANFPQKVENQKPFYVIRKDNLVIGPIPSSFSIFFINQGYFGFDPNDANPGAGAGSSLDTDTSSGTGNSKNSGSTGNTDSGKNSQGEENKSKMRNNPKLPRFSTTPKTPTNGQQNQKPAEPSRDLTPPKMEESQINRPNQPENTQSQPPIQQQPEPILDLPSVPDPPIDNSGQIALMMATFLGGLLVGFAPLVVTQLLLNATMILMQIMMIFQPTPSPIETSTMHTLPNTTIMGIPVIGMNTPATVIVPGYI